MDKDDLIKYLQMTEENYHFLYAPEEDEDMLLVKIWGVLIFIIR